MSASWSACPPPLPNATSASPSGAHSPDDATAARAAPGGIGKAMILFFDLDGPLLDVSARYVALHRDLLREIGELLGQPDFAHQFSQP